MNKIICYYICKIHFKALAFLYLLLLTLIKFIYTSCWSSDCFRKLTIFDHKYEIPDQVPADTGSSSPPAEFLRPQVMQTVACGI